MLACEGDDAFRQQLTTSTASTTFVHPPWQILYHKLDICVDEKRSDCRDMPYRKLKISRSPTLFLGQ
jgi:hypothetical protein